MKLSEVLKKYAYSFSEVENIEIIACDDVHVIGLTCTICNDIPIYEIWTIDDFCHKKLIECYFDKETAEKYYNFLIQRR